LYNGILQACHARCDAEIVVFPSEKPRSYLSMDVTSVLALLLLSITVASSGFRAGW